MERDCSSVHHHQNNYPYPSTTTIDKSRVLDVKPLRSLVPVFTSSPQEPPFVCSPPYGPYPPGFTPFYPFSSPNNNAQQHASTPHGPNKTTTQVTPGPTPLRSYRASDASNNGDTHMSDDDDERVFVGKPAKKKSVARRKSGEVNINNSKNNGGGLVAVTEELHLSMPSAQKEDGDKGSVDYVMMVFDSVRRRLSQKEGEREAQAGVCKSANLKAGKILMSKDFRTNNRKRVGNVPGVEVGDIFFFRLEMCLVGLHGQAMAGIDAMACGNDSQKDRIAISIVSAGVYEDEAEDSDVLIYSGQGGKEGQLQTSDQKLERGNLALDISSRRGNVIRVIRGVKDTINPLSKVYIYDGLYTVQESWVEKEKSGCNVFKYKLIRLPGQPNAFATLKAVQKWKEGFASRAGVILPDLSAGAERIPVALVNEVDDIKGPAYFTYSSSLTNAKSFSLTDASFGCNCRKACVPGDPNCSCIQKNSGRFPYTTNDVLVSRMPLIHECGPSCPCSSTCKTRVSQTGLKVRLEVFKTKHKGWGLRSWDPIRAGTFICVYAGEVAESANQNGEEGDDEYMFDTTRVYDGSFKWSHESADKNEEYNIPFPLRVSSKNVGNVARFMNHSCYPNVFWQPIVYDVHDETFLQIAFFAIKHIPPMTELTYDYGVSQSGKSMNVLNWQSKCLCGSQNCRGVFY